MCKISADVYFVQYFGERQFATTEEAYGRFMRILISSYLHQLANGNVFQFLRRYAFPIAQFFIVRFIVTFLLTNQVLQLIVKQNGAFTKVF